MLHVLIFNTQFSNRVRSCAHILGMMIWIQHSFLLRNLQNLKHCCKFYYQFTVVQSQHDQASKLGGTYKDKYEYMHLDIYNIYMK